NAVCVSDGEAALRSLEAELPALAIVDLLMPTMDGFALIERLRRRADGRAFPVIVWSGKELRAADRASLDRLSASIVPKGEHGTEALLAEVLHVLLDDGVLRRASKTPTVERSHVA